MDQEHVVLLFFIHGYPVCLKAAGLVEELTPLLNDLRAGGLVNNLEALTKSVAEAASDIQSLQQAVLDDENIGAIRGAVKTLTQTLQDVEVSSRTSPSRGFTVDRPHLCSISQFPFTFC